MSCKYAVTPFYLHNLLLEGSLLFISFSLPLLYRAMPRLYTCPPAGLRHVLVCQPAVLASPVAGIGAAPCPTPERNSCALPVGGRSAQRKHARGREVNPTTQLDVDYRRSARRKMCLQERLGMGSHPRLVTCLNSRASIGHLPARSGKNSDRHPRMRAGCWD